VSSTCQTDGRCDYVCRNRREGRHYGGANAGQTDVKAKSIGLNITLHTSKHSEPLYITPALNFQFRLFRHQENDTSIIRAKQLARVSSRRISVRSMNCSKP